MASNSTSNEIVRPSSTSATPTRSVGLRSLFSSCRNCFDCCFSLQSNAVPSTTHAFKEIRPSPPDTLPSNQIEPEVEDTNAFKGITPSPSNTNALEQIGISTSTFEQIEAKNEHSNAFKGIITSESSSNRPTIPQRKLSYDVFINHRGPDVKHTLAHSLYETLSGIGLRVFLDKKELELGDFLPAEIEQVIRGASFHIAIFSQNYAESPWCLAELAFMLETGTRIVPVFYHVETDVVRFVKGVYAKAFSRHEEKGRYTSKLLCKWKNALQNVSYNVGGIVHNEDDEQRLLKNIVNRVLKEIKHVPFVVAKHPVGLDKAFKDFERTALQSAESHHSVQLVGIWGMGGSGKTTLAKQIYNNKYSIMDKSSLLLDVRDAASTSKLHKKQKKLLQDFGLQGISIENIEEGKKILSSRLQSIRVLIIVDDVDNVDQLDALVPTWDNLGSGSLIVVTSRELQVLRSWGISSIYKMKALSPTHANQLFCWHVFLQSSPHQGFEDLVESFLNVCHGLPLSLKVFGAQLYGIKNKNYWKTQLHKISRILPNDIKKILEISYDALEDEEKQVFLDIACFFIGTKITSAIATWDVSGWSGLYSWEQLVHKCLVESNGDRIRMHDHLRDLGRAIAIEQSPYRLWSPQQVINVDNVGQAIALRGIMGIASGSTSEIEFPECSVSEGGRLIVNTNRGPYTLEPSSLGLKILHVQRNSYDQVIGELSRELVWLCWKDIEHSNLRSLKSLKNLRVLELYEKRINGKHCLKELWENDKNAPVQLRELVINGCSEFQGFPKSIGSLKHLKKIVLSYSRNLRSLPEEFCLLQSLEYLHLTRTELSSLPNSFGHLTNLEHLDFSCCYLSSLPNSFGDLRNLRHLDLSYSQQLGRLPVSFKELRFLQHLNLHGCSKLTFESDILENMMKLQYFNIDGCDQLEELPRHITNQASLTELYCEIRRLMEVPVSIGQLRKLERIRIGGEFLTSLPTSMGDLSSLTSLTISYCARLQCLPDSLGCLNLLNVLHISNCPKIKCLPDSFGCLNLLSSLVIVGLGVQSFPKPVGELVNLQALEIRRCPISELDLGVRLFTSLMNISLEATEVSKISISEDSCPVLANLSLCNNKNLTHIEVLPNSLQKIHLEGNPKLEALPSFAQSAFLREFKLEGCYRVKKIHGLEHCTALEKLIVHTRLEEAGIGSLERMERLRRVELKADSRSGVESCIQSMKKWPREKIIVCAQAAPDAASLVNSIVFPNLSVVDSFAKRKIKSDPALKWPSTARCILLCYVVDCESPETSLQLAGSGGNLQRKIYFGDRAMKLEKGKWAWTGLFTQHSILLSSMSINMCVHCTVPYEVKEGEVSGVVVTGEEEHVKEAFSYFWASLLN